jgi:LysM repeat protein
LRNDFEKMLKNKFKFILFLLLIACVSGSLPAQPKEMSQEEYELIHDEYAIIMIKMLMKYEAANEDVEKLKQILQDKDDEIAQKETELYALVGASVSSVNDFRRKFEETEKRINSRTGTPSDARNMYFDEIYTSKIKCLPEFADRFESMRNRMENWEGTGTTQPVVTEAPQVPEGTYLVVKGDCLWKISQVKFGSPYYWPAIWEANKNGVVNRDELYNFKHKAITDPNLIYPGQVLKIPSVNTDPTSTKEEFKERFKKFRKIRKKEEKK